MQAKLLKTIKCYKTILITGLRLVLALLTEATVKIIDKK
jgi:hypothetical protein